ncbi:hypothetical protein NQ318_008455 [Aromia moschata]|uniref:RING-type domain-containing protein n=1 Tax=Aromia moschata TaxID=1265417 RepID=A0AAV8YC65_9CUCU|nr:hypothetical protein NQ318_008455 [Aromia moschata]
MLVCQHTFCLKCLNTLLVAKNLTFKHEPSSSDKMKMAVSSEIKSFNCPLCQQEIALEKGIDSLENLPKNLYIDSLLKLLSGSQSPSSPKNKDYRCVKCETVSQQQQHVCQHCMQVFCEICWNGHISELDSNLSLLVKQINESESRLRYKADNFNNRCDKLNDTIKETVEQKIQNIHKMEKRAFDEVTSLKEQGTVRYENINARILELKDKIQYNINEGRNGNKITMYMNLHRETAKLLNEIYHYAEARIIFDPETFCLDQDTEGIYNEIEDNNGSAKTADVENPFESVSAMVKHYKARSFVPKLLWTKCPRPGGIGIPPWDDSKIYIAATDSHNVIILDRAKFKLVGRINNPEMICPTGLAFSKARKEIFVGEYLQSLWSHKLRSPEGIAMGPNGELIICDTGNDRVLIINAESGELVSAIGYGGSKTRLSVPTSVAVYGANIIVADTGNHRIKTFNMKGELLSEFGSLGRNQSQFRSAEVVAVDCLGFIFVGDAGNARIQVFHPDGTLVKIFGSREGFGWVSGIYITPELDIITTDSKTRTLRIF